MSNLLDSNAPLALRYRPRRFSDVVGQRAPRVVLQQMLRTDQVHPALLFYGVHGSGKTSMARVFVAALNCEAAEVAARPCGECASCVSIATGTSADVIEVDAASSGMADDIRALREQVRFAASSRYRAIVLDEAHAMSDRGSDALLKTLEEPPANTVFILVTTELGRISDTIASRCRSMEFRRVTEAEIADRLIKIADSEAALGREMGLGGPLAAAVAQRSRGILRDAVNLAEQCALVGVREPAQLDMLLGVANHGLEVLSALAPDPKLAAEGASPGPDLPQAFAVARVGLESLPGPGDLIAALTESLRRALVLASGSEQLVPPPLPDERALAATLPPAQWALALRVIWEYLAKIASATDAYASMDLLIVMLGQALTPRG